jgi:hypothetical protein
MLENPMNAELAETPRRERRGVPSPDAARRSEQAEQLCLLDLVRVLLPHRGGLRRWSVMRAMRNNRIRQSRDIPQKFEDDVERVFRRYCAEDAENRICSAEIAPFYRPRETAGEVWALHPERAEALLSAVGSPEA